MCVVHSTLISVFVRKFIPKVTIKRIPKTTVINFGNRLHERRKDRLTNDSDIDYRFTCLCAVAAKEVTMQTRDHGTMTASEIFCKAS